MKIIPSSRGRHYLARVGIILITVALIAWMVDSVQPEAEYTPIIAAGQYHTVGLKSDGTVVAVGDNYDGQCDVGSQSWTDIVQVAAGDFHTVGLKADGTVVAVGYVIGDVGGWDLD